MNIPNEIWIEILKYLKDDLKSLANFTRVSNYFNLIANDEYLWQYFCMKLYFYDKITQLEKEKEKEYKKRKNRFKEKKEFKNWKQIYKIYISTNIKTFKIHNAYVSSLILKGDNNIYYSSIIRHYTKKDDRLLLYDPEQNDKLLNIIDIIDYFSSNIIDYYNIYSFSIMTDDNRIFNIDYRTQKNSIIIKNINKKSKLLEHIKKILSS